MANNRVSPFDIQDSSILDGEFSTFCSNLETIQRKFLEEWIKTWKESREEKIEKIYQSALTECEGSIEKLKQKTKDQELRSIQLKDVVQKLEKQKLQTDTLEEKCSDEEKRCKDILEKFELKSADLIALEKVNAAKKEKISKALDYFKQRLGLEFKNLKGEEQIQVIFKMTDECDTSRQFFFNTKIVESQYEITGCNPSINNLDDFVQELNSTNDFSRFIVKMRKAFKKSINESKENNPPI